MSKIFKSAITSTVKRAKGVGTRVKTALLLACAVFLNPIGAFAQSLANTGYEAGTNALSTVTEEIAKYIPYVVKLCYAIAGVVAVVGAISVYIAMNNALFWTATNVVKCTDIEQFAET